MLHQQLHQAQLKIHQLLPFIQSCLIDIMLHQEILKPWIVTRRFLILRQLTGVATESSKMSELQKYNFLNLVNTTTIKLSTDI